MKGSKSKIKHDEGDTSLLTAFRAVKLSNVISSLVCSITHACYQAPSYYVSFSSLQPATGWWTCLYIHKGGTERAPFLQSGPRLCALIPLLCFFSPTVLSLSSLALVWCPTWVSLAVTKAAVQLWALGTKYRSTPHPTLCHPKDRFQWASDFVLSLCFQKSSSFFQCTLFPLNKSLFTTPSPASCRENHEGIFMCFNGLANPLVWIPLPCSQGPRNGKVTFILWPTGPPGSQDKFWPFQCFKPHPNSISAFQTRKVLIHCARSICTCQILQPAHQWVIQLYGKGRAKQMTNEPT